MDVFNEYLRDHGPCHPSRFAMERISLLERRLQWVESRAAGTTWRRDLEEDFQRLRAGHPAERWRRDSELFAVLHRLLRDQNGATPAHDLARLHLIAGSRDIEEMAGQLPPGFYRRLGEGQRTHCVRAGRVEDVTDQVVFRVAGFEPPVYLPLPGLFGEMLNESFYPSSRRPFPGVRLRRRVRGAIERLRQYSVDLHEAMSTSLSNVVLLPKGAPRSYNLGFNYYGGIFVRGHEPSEYLVAESLIHEYFHSCSWLLWDVFEPEGCPPAQVRVQSPVSHKWVEAHSMIDALLIYTHQLHFNRWIVESSLTPSSERLPAQGRVHFLEERIPVLHERLCEVVPPHTPIRRFLDFGMELYPAGRAVPCLTAADVR